MFCIYKKQLLYLLIYISDGEFYQCDTRIKKKKDEHDQIMDTH